MKNINLKELKKDLKNPRATIPNLLSASRMFAPLVIPPLALSGNIPLTIIVAAAFMSTDFLDGKIARALNGQTKLGQLLDQISDKVCAIGLLLALIPTIPLMMIPLILEGIIAAINIRTTKKGANIKSTQSGRLKMWPLSISLISGYGMIMSPSIIFNIITYLGLTATTVLEAINIKEYHDIAVKYDEELVKEKENKEIKPETEENEKQKTYTKSKDLNMYIDNCMNIDELKEIKEIINPNEITETKQKTKTKKRF